MYIGALPPVSNRASWKLLQEVVDDDTSELVSLSGLTITVEVIDPLDCTTVLSATTANGKVTIVDTGTFQAAFTRDEMATLCARTYQVGVTLADSDDTVQIIIGTLPVLNGVVSK